MRLGKSVNLLRTKIPCLVVDTNKHPNWQIQYDFGDPKSRY